MGWDGIPYQAFHMSMFSQNKWKGKEIIYVLCVNFVPIQAALSELKAFKCMLPFITLCRKELTQKLSKIHIELHLAS